MTQDEARKLPLGLYHLYWKDGGSSLAAVGQLYNGDRWFAPCNWTNPSEMGIASRRWRGIERVAKIITISETKVGIE